MEEDADQSISSVQNWIILWSNLWNYASSNLEMFIKLETSLSMEKEEFKSTPCCALPMCLISIFRLQISIETTFNCLGLLVIRLWVGLSSCVHQWRVKIFEVLGSLRVSMWNVKSPAFEICFSVVLSKNWLISLKKYDGKWLSSVILTFLSSVWYINTSYMTILCVCFLYSRNEEQDYIMF